MADMTENSSSSTSSAGWKEQWHKLWSFFKATMEPFLMEFLLSSFSKKGKLFLNRPLKPMNLPSSTCCTVKHWGNQVFVGWSKNRTIVPHRCNKTGYCTVFSPVCSVHSWCSYFFFNFGMYEIQTQLWTDDTHVECDWFCLLKMVTAQLSGVCSSRACRGMRRMSSLELTVSGDICVQKHELLDLYNEFQHFWIERKKKNVLTGFQLFRTDVKLTLCRFSTALYNLSCMERMIVGATRFLRELVFLTWLFLGKGYFFFSKFIIT